MAALSMAGQGHAWLRVGRLELGKLRLGQDAPIVPTTAPVNSASCHRCLGSDLSMTGLRKLCSQRARNQKASANQPGQRQPARAAPTSQGGGVGINRPALASPSAPSMQVVVCTNADATRGRGSLRSRKHAPRNCHTGLPHDCHTSMCHTNATQILTFRPFPIKPHEFFIGKGRFCLYLYCLYLHAFSVCRHLYLHTYFACTCILAQDFGGLHCLTVSLVAPRQNWPQHQTNY